jgi:serine/threonine protein kinase
MGEVYRARDVRLKRDVAIKVLPEAFSTEPSRLARFQREAEVLASLNHPHIAHIHGVEESGNVRALIMEFVEGEDLAQRIGRGPIALDEALPIARQIAEALEAAHEQGIIHRDLKPANIKLRGNGAVKVLDFGLAKAMESTEVASASGVPPPTITAPAMTQAGIILGTAAYLSPEQVRGKAVDKRIDTWAFGCVLFEMLTGRRPFNGETLTDTMLAILEKDPDWEALPRGTPTAVQSVIARCLRKDPARRLRDIADGRLEIEESMNEPTRSTADLRPASKTRELAGWMAAALCLSALLLVAARRSTAPSSDDVVSLQIFPPEKMSFSAPTNVTVSAPSFALSPDGQKLVFSAESPGTAATLWLRSMDDVAARQLVGTDNAHYPFWSPDSRWIAFVADGKLKKIPAVGGAVQIISDVTTDFRGGSWGDGDTIVFGSGRQPIRLVSSSGGKPQPITAIDPSGPEATHRFPGLLSNGRFLYLILGNQPDRNGVYVGSLDGKTKKFLFQLNASAVYAPPGYLLFVDGDALLAQAFDAERLELEGRRLPVAERVGRSTTLMSAVSVSRTGTIAYAANIRQYGRLTWFDREGQLLTAAATPEGEYADFRLSPDDRYLGASLLDPSSNVLEGWVRNLERGDAARLTSGTSATASLVWSPDGATVTFRSNRTGIIEFYQKSAHGGGSDRLLVSSAELPSTNSVPTDWSPDGRHLLFSTVPESDYDLWLLTLGDGGKPAKLIASRGDQMHGNFSPDGRLLAYTSNESGRFEVYVETIPQSDRKWPVSTSGGYEPRWRADGRELYYLSEDRKLMAVPVDTGPRFGIPKPLFQTAVRAGVSAMRTHFVPSRDGQRFLVNSAIVSPPSPITVVVKWTRRAQ